MIKFYKPLNQKLSLFHLYNFDFIHYCKRTYLHKFLFLFLLRLNIFFYNIFQELYAKISLVFQKTSSNFIFILKIYFLKMEMMIY